MTSLLLPEEKRREAWKNLGEKLEDYIKSVDDLNVPQNATAESIHSILKTVDFAKEIDVNEAIEWTNSLLKKHLLHIASADYYGVFNPQASSMSLIADAFLAVYNPQLASSASAMLCIEMENHLLRFFANKFGLNETTTKGSFTSGATEANFMALLCALAEKIDNYRSNGLKKLDKWPVVYCSQESHGSIKRSCRISGLGTDALQVIDVVDNLQMNLEQLEQQINEDIKEGRLPLMVVANLGSTSSGTIDNLDGIAKIAKKYNIWFHVDAAWGGAALLLEEYSYLRESMENADSVSFDPHKWLSIAIGCGMFLVKRGHLLRQTFSIESTAYMPDETQINEQSEPYRDTLQWSRRFTGLKLFLTLLVHGEKGYSDVLQHQIDIGKYLKEQLQKNSWQVLNSTPWPVACFVDTKHNCDVKELLNLVNSKGDTWITNTELMWKKRPVLRVGISNFRTDKENIDKLITALENARTSLVANKNA
ncbi:aspartate aminotransferase family protein [Candidatus Uabimicrobium sp. HlEnr_7]|uniref:pyridoxal phosphate-dependent decarboxylase family protein n=1 Tax=Candidatus Uabimicrobium helgolandensis TaxID=3095367 RepID=UPI00355632AE